MNERLSEYYCRIAGSLLILLLVFCGCGDSSPVAKGKMSAGQILMGEMNAARHEIVAEQKDVYSDLRAYRDEASNEIIVEYTYIEGLKFPESPVDLSEFRKKVIAFVRDDESIREVLKEGDVFVYRYKKFNGELYQEATIRESDFE